MAAAAVMKPKAVDLHDDKMDVDIEDSEEDLYTKLKTLQRQLEFIEIQVRLADLSHGSWIYPVELCVHHRPCARVFSACQGSDSYDHHAGGVHQGGAEEPEA
jgi:hypothetical protein